MTQTWQNISGKLVVSDPCYDYETVSRTKGFCIAGVVENVWKGTWIARANLEEESGRVASLSTWSEKSFSALWGSKCIGKGWKKAPFFVCVDSGQAGVFDYDFYPKGKGTGEYKDVKTFYGQACEITLSKEQWGVMRGGVVSSSGYGDGSYDCFIHRNDDGIADAVHIVFLGDDEE